MKLFSAFFLSLALLLSACTEQRKFISTDLSMVDWGKDFQLTDHTGKPRRLADFQGKAVVLFFGYTQCPDVCPTTLSTMREAMSLLGQDAKRVQVLFVTVDPARDTPQLLAQYVPSFHPDLPRPVWRRRRPSRRRPGTSRSFIVKQPGKTPDTYSVDHSTGSYAFDPQGRLRLLLRHGETPTNVAADLKTAARRQIDHPESSSHEKAAS
jgi:protein SCO1/2